jgi:ABC-2 type transport system permease protein
VSAVTLDRVVRSEAIKLATLRSTIIGYLLIAVSMVVVAGICLTLSESDDGASANAALAALLLVELLVGITSVAAASGEYSARTIRSTFTAVPRRLTVLAAKLLVHGGLVVALMLLAVLAAIVGGAIIAPDAVGPVTDPKVVRAILGTVMALGGVCVLGLAFGMLTRSAAAAAGILFTVMFLPVIVVSAPAVTAFLPGRAIQAVVLSDNPPEARLLHPWVSVAVFLAWLVASVAVTAVMLRRRDA